MYFHVYIFISTCMKTMEICFEGLSSPGLYIGNSSMLSSFCAGRANSLVVDIGASGTSISPIIDGYELKRSSMRLNRGGDTIDKLLYEELMRIYSNKCMIRIQIHISSFFIFLPIWISYNFAL